MSEEGHQLGIRLELQRRHNHAHLRMSRDVVDCVMDVAAEALKADQGLTSDHLLARYLRIFRDGRRFLVAVTWLLAVFWDRLICRQKMLTPLSYRSSL